MISDHIFNIDKPEDWTSFDVVNKIRYQTRIKKVGHAGTLDPFATGVLVILTGKNTKRAAEFTGLTKEYVALVKLGTATDTADRTGEVLRRSEIPDLSEELLKQSFLPFLGEIQQVPPMYSAKKVKGKKLYELARKGKEIEREPATIRIDSIELLNMGEDSFGIRVVCGKGTYIRVLAEDLGRELGCEAHLQELRRTAVGDYRIDDAWTIDEFIDKWKSYAA